jgi:hypothetical protein
MTGSSPAGGSRHEGNGKKTHEIKVRLPEQVASGVYANSMMVQHTREEFVMDFTMVAAGTGTVVSRVITSPGHMKRVVAALEENLRRYEAAYGPIKGGEGQPPMIVGFQPPSGGDN